MAVAVLAKGFVFLSLMFPSSQALTPQQKLLRDYGVEALDQTDRHAPAVLESFYFLLKNAFTPEFVRGLRGLRYLYAYAGHDRLYDLAAYHPDAKAISIGGQSAYGDLRGVPDVKVLMTLAHEMGHVYLLERVTLPELRDVGERFGGWGSVLSGAPLQSYYAKALFSRHPASTRTDAEGDASEGDDERRRHSLCSGLALRNVHEWFADAFAAAMLRRLGQSGVLGPRWHEQVISRPKSRRMYWHNYHLVSEGFSAWLDTKLKPPAAGLH